MWLCCLLLAFSVNGLPQGKVGKQDSDICTSRECIAISHRLFEYMNFQVDPCEDFDEFACGNFRKDNAIPEDKGSFSSSSPLSEKIHVRARKLLEEEPKEKSLFKTDQLMRDHYKSCINESKIEELGLKPMKQLLNKIGGWPVLEGSKWSSNGSQWYDIVPKMNELGLGISYILNLYIGTDVKNNSWRALWLDQPGLGMTRKYLINGFDNREVQLYYKYMVNSAILMGAVEELAKEELKESLLFEIALAKISAPVEERRDLEKLYNPTTVGQFEILPGFPPSLKEYIDELAVTGGAPEIKIEDNEKLIVTNPSFNKKLSDLLVQTSPRVIANYNGWRVFKSMVPYLNKDAKVLVEEYNRELLDVEKSTAIWKQCVVASGFNTYSETFFINAAASMYARSYFKPEDKKIIEDIVKYVRNAFKSILNNNDWMDDKTRSNALKKLDAMEQCIGYPDEVLDPKEVDDLYNGLHIDRETYFNNVLALSTFWRQKNYRKLRQKNDPNHWTERKFVALDNAFYSPHANSFHLPAGILQGLFFNPEAPKYINFGAIGGVVGHEITHGFDDQGRQRDFDGSLVDWWQGDTAEKYKEKSQCIINQYGNYTAEQVGMKLNGINTQGENIADNVGTKEAYLAYNNYVEENGSEPKLAGHDFTPKQLFWISYAHSWCSKYRDGTLKNKILRDNHSPAMFRIKGPLSNNEDFAKDFGCPKGSPMNPEIKCKVW